MANENEEAPENIEEQPSAQDESGVEPEAQEGGEEFSQTSQLHADDSSGEPGKKNESKAGVSSEKDASEFIEKVVAINRITKVTKGGKKLSFSALVVVGDTHGKVGYSLEKAAEVSIAIRKAMGTAKKNMIQISIKGTTIPHEIIGKCGGSRVLLKPASDGTGVIAAGPVRAVCDGAGIHNILTKCHRSNNPINVVKATIDGLTRLKSARTPTLKEKS